MEISKLISFSYFPLNPILPGSSPPCPGSITITFFEGLKTVSLKTNRLIENNTTKTNNTDKTISMIFLSRKFSPFL
jgi:hypothetical protein